MQTKTDRFIQSVFVLMNTRGVLVVVRVMGLEIFWSDLTSYSSLPIF
ncbi:hypothetical protein SDC9_80883 [bioreactor metagenome]|uniref:Uncharacterized protein n=1 Tax=bioreactor metagenome TaxID=1076179 RepID=A0A644Z2R1_9ZZZZ